MVPLVLLGSLSDKRAGQALKELFSQRVSFLHICGSRLDLCGTSPDFLIYETDTLEHFPYPLAYSSAKNLSASRVFLSVTWKGRNVIKI